MRVNCALMRGENVGKAACAVMGVVAMGWTSAALAASGNFNFDDQPDKNLGRIMQGSTPSTTLSASRGSNGNATAALHYAAGISGLSSTISGSGNGAPSPITVSLLNTAAGTGSPSIGSKSWTVSMTGDVTSGHHNSVNISATILANRVVTASTVDLGTAIVGGTWTGTSDLSTTGANDVATAVSIATTGGPAGGISITGGTGSSFQSATATGTRLLSGSFATAGNHSGTVTLTTTGEGLTGEAPINVGVGYSAIALDHSNASFSGDSDQNVLTIDFGTVDQNSTQSQGFSLYNRMAMAGFTAGLDLDGLTKLGDALGRFSTTLPDSATPHLLAAGSSLPYSIGFDTSSVGLFTATYTLLTSDENLNGATAGTPLTINVIGQVVAVPEPTSLGLLGMMGAGLLRRRR